MAALTKPAPSMLPQATSAADGVQKSALPLAGGSVTGDITYKGTVIPQTRLNNGIFEYYDGTGWRMVGGSEMVQFGTLRPCPQALSIASQYDKTFAIDDIFMRTYQAANPFSYYIYNIKTGAKLAELLNLPSQYYIDGTAFRLTPNFYAFATQSTSGAYINLLVFNKTTNALVSYQVQTPYGGSFSSIYLMYVADGKLFMCGYQDSKYLFGYYSFDESTGAIGATFTNGSVAQNNNISAMCYDVASSNYYICSFTPGGFFEVPKAKLNVWLNDQTNAANYNRKLSITSNVVVVPQAAEMNVINGRLIVRGYMPIIIDIATFTYLNIGMPSSGQTRRYPHVITVNGEMIYVYLVRQLNATYQGSTVSSAGQMRTFFIMSKVKANGTAISKRYEVGNVDFYGARLYDNFQYIELVNGKYIFVIGTFYDYQLNLNGYNQIDTADITSIVTEFSTL